jgi:hypothetical protein
MVLGMCASQNVTRRIDDLVQSNHVNHSIPNGPHVRPLTSFKFSSKTSVYINPFGPLLFSSSHPHSSQCFFEKLPVLWAMSFLALRTSSFPKPTFVKVMFILLAPILKMFSKKPVAVNEMLSLALGTVARISKHYIRKH